MSTLIWGITAKVVTTLGPAQNRSQSSTSALKKALNCMFGGGSSTFLAFYEIFKKSSTT